MKKALSLILSLVVLLAFAACSNEDATIIGANPGMNQVENDIAGTSANVTTETTAPSPTEGCTTCPTQEIPTTSTQCSHTYADATCTVPETCIECGATNGDALGHNWVTATCEAPNTCTNCGITNGNALGHNWVAATCVAPNTCANCGITNGNALGHNWISATCTAPNTCTNCGTFEGLALGHNWISTTVYSKECQICGAEEIDQSKLPVKLGSLTPSGGANYSSSETKTDIYGNTFSEGLLLYHEGWSTGNHQSTEYVLNREYQKFNARIMINKLRDDFEVTLKIYVDGIMVYDSGLMTKTTQPIDISIDVSNAMFLTIETDKTKGAGTVMISDPMLHH